ncbi:tetratricopeptide repeat protein [Nonomuraea sp. NPDC051941]|uniref:tetratricopeptide repeat protein n=1 Tax=Nonomuraea sp. NPDC051941 TaxID=3364373 RepID=UPI0037C707AC
MKLTQPWAVALAAIGSAMIVSGSALWWERTKRLAQHSDEQVLKVQDGCLALADGSLPRVSAMEDPVPLGVHPAGHREHSARSNVTPGDANEQPRTVPVYIPRDIDDDLRELLARGGFVLVVGDSTAGKSRASWEAVRATLPEHTIIAPVDRDAVRAAVSVASERRRCVLWLDDAEGYLGKGGLRRNDVQRLVSGKDHHRVIVATLRAAEEERLTAHSAEEGRQAAKDVEETLSQAHRIYLPRMFSASERERARARDWDPRIAQALDHADDYGIAEYIAAGPELLRDWQNAWSPNTEHGAPTHPRAAALISVAVELRRAGHSAAIPRALLEQFHEHYLSAHGGSKLRPEPLPAAWEWATKPRRATTALLQPVDRERVEVFDYLVDIVQRTAGPGHEVAAKVLLTALPNCSPSDADAIATTAYNQGRFEVAVAGWQAAGVLPQETAADTLNRRNNLARALRKLGRLHEAEAEHRAVIAERTRILGPRHADALISRDNLANVIRDLGRLDEAEAEHRHALAELTDVLGPEHSFTLFSRDNRAVTLRLLGRLQEAEAEHRCVVQIRTRLLGHDHPNTLVSRDNLAATLCDQKRFTEAEAEYEAVLRSRIRVLGEGHPYTAATRESLAALRAQEKNVSPE